MKKIYILGFHSALEIFQVHVPGIENPSTKNFHFQVNFNETVKDYPLFRHHNVQINTQIHLIHQNASRFFLPV